MAQEEEEMLLLRMRHDPMGVDMGMDVDMDALMADAIAQQEAAEVDALVEGLELESGGHQFSDDDEDYDGLLLDFIQKQEREQQSGLGGGVCHEQDVEMS